MCPAQCPDHRENAYVKLTRIILFAFGPHLRSDFLDIRNRSRGGQRKTGIGNRTIIAARGHAAGFLGCQAVRQMAADAVAESLQFEGDVARGRPVWISHQAADRADCGCHNSDACERTGS